MTESPKDVIIRDLQSVDDLEQAEALEREVWGLADRDVMPLTLMIATKEAGSVWVGAFDGPKLAGFAFGFLAMEAGHITLHSHMLAVREPYRDLDLGYKLKLAQRERTLAMRIPEMTWTFDPAAQPECPSQLRQTGRGLGHLQSRFLRAGDFERSPPERYRSSVGEMAAGQPPSARSSAGQRLSARGA